MANINRSALDALSLTNFPNNTSQLISPADLRDWLDNGIDSFVTQKDKSRLENAIYENQGSGLAASATVDLTSATGNYLHITGAFNGITSFGVIPAGGRFVLVFDDICTLTNSATLILPGGSDITTAAGDCAMLVSEGSGNWRMVGFFPISGGGGGGVTSVTATAPIASSGGTTPDISIPQANGTTDGFLDSADWTTFNNKQAAGNYITALTGDVTATGPGSVAATIANDAVTYAKIQNVSTNNRLLGRATAGAGDVEEITLGTGLSFTGTTLNASVGGTPGGINTELQFNNSGSFGGVPNATWDGTNLTFNNPRIGQSLGNGHFSIHRSNTVPGGATDYLTIFWNQTNKDLGFRFETDGFESYFRFAATTSDKTYTFPDLSGTVALLANPASFSSLTSTSSVTIGTAGPTGTTGTIVLQNATNANTLTLQSGTTSTSYTITLPPAASVGPQYLQTTGTGGTLQWTSGTTTGVSTVGTFSASAQTNGASISGSVITFGPASDTVPGMISTGAQTIGGGTKTFNLPASTGSAISITSVGTPATPQLNFTPSSTSIAWISFSENTTGVNAPAYTGVAGTTRSTGTKIAFRPNNSATLLDNAIGISSTSMWLSSSGNIQFWPNNGGGGASPLSCGQFEYATSGGITTARGLKLNAATDSNITFAQLYINGGTAQMISFAAATDGSGTGNPAFTAGSVVRSAGTKIILLPLNSASASDMAIGVNNSTGVWFTAAGGGYDFYTGNVVSAATLRIASTGLTLAANCSISMATTGTGGMIGTTASQLVGFHGVAGTVQRAAAAQAAVVTTAATQITPWGYSTAAQADGVITLLNEIRTVLVNKGLMKGSA